MKVAEILSESAKDEQRLQLIARELIQTINKDIAEEMQYRVGNARNGRKPEPPIVDLGFIKELVPPKTLGHLHNRLNRVKVRVNFGREVKNIAGVFHSGDNLLELFYPMNSESKSNFLESIVVHELRHALDSSKSKRWALHSKPKAKEGDPYLAAPHEINARFSQMQRELTQLIQQDMQSERPLDIKTVMGQIHDLLQKWHIVQVFPSKNEISGSTPEGKPLDNKNYRQILKRSIKYFDAEKKRLSKNNLYT